MMRILCNQMKMWKLILLSVLFLGVSADSLWPRDTYDLQFFLNNEGHNCLMLVKQFPIFMFDKSFTPEQEREVLLDIYTSTNGQQWYESSGWNSSTSHCSWYGITCHNNTYIKTIVLPYNNLDGSLPSNLWKIRNLFSLCMPGNPSLRGRIGDFLFGNMSQLLTLVFSTSSVAGDIPPDIVNMRSLQRFLGSPMDGEGFSGRLPEDLGNMIELRALSLGGNNLTGQIPRSISRLEKLWYLDLRNTPDMMHGHLSDLFAIPSLSYLYVSGVELIGEMPRMLPAKLAFLVLPGNNISESPILPNEFYLRTLSTCDLRGNRFYGRIPDVLVDFSVLAYLDVSANNLSGGIPGGTQNLISLQYLDISGNPLMRKGKSISSNVCHPDFSRMVRPPQGDNFTCPEGRLAFNNGRIRLDPTFYEYRYCVCDPNFYGHSGLCKKCMNGGKCPQIVFTESDDLRQNVMTLRSGYWPSPDSQNATHLVKCPVSSACNPSDSCTCRLDTTPKHTNSTRYRPSVSSLITRCNQSCICHPGNTDRFCSRCQDAFYKIGGLCLQCTKGDLTYYYLFIPIFAVSFLVFTLVIFLF
ncbi:hypothetical protein OS493_035071 [Desmophyllum pertusum]|uniref:Leucine-rich repeat-containing N-terminal plant-type domain-containing protein n=1 Tax=Desmophyllum pertusum TaxID=174260 RepID=A0A9X0D095_9CNID|nr:hypothetical protein OS493_035071 [Desmophyllum pertusum]